MTIRKTKISLGLRGTRRPTPPKDACSTLTGGPETPAQPSEVPLGDLEPSKKRDGPIRTAMKILGGTLICLAAGCPSTDEVAEPTPGPTPEPIELELFSYELGEPAGSADEGTGEEQVWDVTRFHHEVPLRIHAIEAMWRVRSGDDRDAHLAIIPDEGHNFYDHLREAPYAEWHLDLNKDDHDLIWQRFELEEPIELAWPGLFYVGQLYRGEPGQSMLSTDAEGTIDPYLTAHASGDDVYPTRIRTYIDRPLNQSFEVNTMGGGDLMVRLFVEYFDVPEGEPWFHERHRLEEDERSGLPGSRSPSFGDCNDDGFDDSYIGSIYVNNGDGTFTQKPADESGIDVGGGTGVWGDYNNDGNIDLFVASNVDQLYEGQGDCVFINVTAASGIDDTQLFNNDPEWDPENGLQYTHAPTPSAAFLDVNNDGLLDIQQANFMNFGTGDSTDDYLWLNQGDGLFINVTDTLGMDQSTGDFRQPSGYAGRGVAVSDYDNDGDVDIFISNYRLHQNLHWRNENAGDSFVDVSFAVGTRGTLASGYYGHTIGSAFGDVDNDGDMDLFAANLAHPRFITFSDKSMFLRNELVETGEANFTEMRDTAGMIYMETDSSPVFLDYDNDGWLDLFYTAIYAARPSYLYRNNGDWTFTMVSHHAGTWIYDGWGVAASDIDNDGDVDLHGSKLFINDYPALGGWMKVTVVGSGTGATNVSGIGAKVRVTTAAGTQLREVQPTTGVGSHNSLTQHFGIGDAATASVEVEFPATGVIIESTADAGTWFVIHEDGTVTTR
jgi:hypothetical protein